MPSLSISQLSSVHWEDSPVHLNEPDKQVHVWRIKITDHHSPLANLLTAAEREKMNHYHHQNDRNRFAVSRGGLRYLLGRYIAKPLGEWPLALNENKKPFLQTRAIEFNIAHSGNYVVLAFAKDDIGLDIEQTDQHFAYTEVMARCFHEQEIAVVKKADDPIEAFYLFWTRKEALLKATGKGINNELHFIPCTDGHQQVNAVSIGSEKDWEIRSFKMEASYTISIAHSPSTEKVCFWEAEL